MSTSSFAARRRLTLTDGLFDYPFTLEYQDQVDLVLTHYPAAGGEALLGLGAQYTITDAAPSTEGDPYPGGTIHLISSFNPHTDDVIVLRRKATPLQSVQTRQNRPLPGPALERALDQIYLKVAEIDDAVSRAYLVPETEPPGAVPEFTIPAPVEGKFLVGGIDGRYELSALFTSGVLSVPVPLAQGGTGATVANDARNNLGLGNSATRNTGISNGNVPLIGSGNKLVKSIIPTGTGSGDVPALGADGLLPVSMIPAGGGEFYPIARRGVPASTATWDIPLAQFGARLAAGGLRVVFLNAHPAAAASMRFRVGKGGNTQTTGYYSIGSALNTAASADTFQSTTPIHNGAYVALQREATAQRAAATSRPAFVVVDIFPDDGSIVTQGRFWTGYALDGVSTMMHTCGSWYHVGAGAVDRVRLYLSTSTFADGSPWDTATQAYVYAMVMP